MIDTVNVQNANPTTMEMRWRSKAPLEMTYIYAYEACKEATYIKYQDYLHYKLHSNAIKTTSAKEIVQK